jgi:two-component system sensor histidine kinase/response regulator
MQGLLKQLVEAKSHPVYDLAPIGLCIIDSENKDFPRLYANSSFIRMLPGNLPPTAEIALREKKDMPAFDLPVANDGWGRLTLTLARIDDRVVTLLWLEDISEAKRIAAEATAMADMKSAFLASMSHEIRTPMQSVYGLLELIHDEPIPQETREMVMTARKSASGLLEILDDILDLAKVEAGKVELDYFEIPLRTLAYGVMECMEVKLLGKPVKMLTDIEQSLPFVLMGDPTRLRQIMLNLVGNAMKFTEKGSITLRINSKVQHIQAPEGGLALRFEVEDTGIGMPPEVRQKLFQAFVQADNSTTRKYGGTGLGLSISQKLTELMGGRIGVDSAAGKGSTFWFEIPTSVASEQTKVDLPNLDGLAVLSVEDHPKGAKEILSSLTSMGAKVESVGTIKDALDLVRKRPFDVAVVDQGLPDGLGIDLLKEAAKLRPFMGLILYTVRNDLGMQYTAKVIGAKYLSKPASRLGLGEAVKAAAKQVSEQDYSGPRRLLIAEDTLAVQDVLRRQLSKLGVEADFVENGVQALAALEKKEHGILFTDLHMPEMDGYQLVAAIRAKEENEKDGDVHRRFPVVAITADVQLTQRQAYLSYGFDECMLKPVSLGQFKQLLIRWGVLKEVPLEETSSAPALTPDAAPAEDASLPPAVDRKAIVQQMGALDAGTIDMMKMFVKMTEPLITKLETAFNDNNAHNIREAAHSLKGSARSACCPHLGNLAADMQTNAEKGTPITADMIAAIKKEFTRVGVEIQNMKV